MPTERQTVVTKSDFARMKGRTPTTVHRWVSGCVGRLVFWCDGLGLRPACCEGFKWTAKSRFSPTR